MPGSGLLLRRLAGAVLCIVIMMHQSLWSYWEAYNTVSFHVEHVQYRCLIVLMLHISSMRIWQSDERCMSSKREAIAGYKLWVTK